MTGILIGLAIGIIIGLLIRDWLDPKKPKGYILSFWRDSKMNTNIQLDPIIQQAIGVIFGGLITWFFSYIYYKRAGNELKEESKELRKRIKWLILQIVNKGNVRLVFDNEGELIDVVQILDIQNATHPHTSENAPLDTTPPK